MGRVEPGMAGLYSLVQARWGGVGTGLVGQGGAGWRSIGYGLGRVHRVVPAVNVPKMVPLGCVHS